MAKVHQQDSSQAAIDALLAEAGERGWKRVSLADIARRANLPLTELHQKFHGKAALLDAFQDRLDEAVLRDGAPAADDPPRDRVFEVVMRRFDAMQPHKEAIRSILRDSRCDPVLWLRGGCRLLRSAALMLEAAGISAWGPGGQLKSKGLLVIYLATLREWLDDGSNDMARTMAVLDRHLRQAEGVVGFLDRTRPAPSVDDRGPDTASA
jgi:AcrR family transcriptional regulator